MQTVINWIWTGPWWTPLVGALYLSVLLGIALSPILGIWKARK
ncbi:MAG: hypothetical protein ACYC7E_17315 [Armatimonadota bacterium]